MIEVHPMHPEVEPEYTSYIPHKSRKCFRADYPRHRCLRKKKVHFSETSMLIVTRPKSSSDLQACWYTKKDIAQFKHHVRVSAQTLSGTPSSNIMKHIAYSVASGSPQSNIDVQEKERFCGLEHLLSPEVLKVLIQRRKMTIARVLEEQDIQIRLKENDPHRLALASMTNSSFTKEWRRRIACVQVS
ncbi:hypothetical protein HJC23_011143 [Cyclotella cryptica]|uniref:Uncharacterized protein n=1 Tax=Cyclotella cryptica TaxID=29204 RepID=A0ABD3P265_9STRA|eukprot:CCRYP_018260-RA/>CCRYP_018260-RA protein AED:0.06 eAED:-0.05 QI:0/-1/0/1/-1/1/1/0/186